jgi:DNA polymerase III sliding clamp (beta) subunit (PCNA family)
MKFTINRRALETLLKAVASRPGEAETMTEEDTVVLSACAGRVFVECKGDIAGIQALVYEDGAVTLPARKFRTLLKTYKGTHSLTFEANADGLRVQTFWMPVLGYDPHPKPPAGL